ncbi:GDSL-type esterase/lipase family protein [Paraburkholderia phenoliruptrix]|nr:GDSL-type esterase/lipase family protein [Paraburkholderia phenoliruptrix]
MLHTTAEAHTAHYLERVKSFEMDKGIYDVAMVGDSLTEGGKWALLFPRVTIANRGISGDTIDGVLHRTETIRSTGAKQIFLMIGVNDVLSGGLSAADIIPSYELMIDSLRATGAQVFVESTLYTDYAGRERVNAQIAVLNHVLADFCRARNVVFIDVNSVLSVGERLREDVTVDHLHLNALGYSLWAAKIRPLLATTDP